MRLRIGAVLAWVLASCVTAAQAAPKDVQNPFILWTKSEAAELKQRIETDPMAKRQYEAMLAYELTPAKSKNSTNPPMLRLFQYAVLGDQKAGETEKKALLNFIGQRPFRNQPGIPDAGHAQWRDDRTIDALRYDVLYDLLTDKERSELDATIRGYVEWLEKAHGPWAKEGEPRTAWLPNMQWTTVSGTHVLALASRDEGLIRRVFEANGGWKWYFDNYITSDSFYMEEFAKYYSNIGAMLLWCEGLEKLGLPQYGYGYKGRDGATMQQLLTMLIRSGYPRINSPDTLGPSYHAVSMGDAGTAVITQPFGTENTVYAALWGGGRMNGSNPRMMNPLWWEIGHRRSPHAGYDYFLAQLRKPGEDVYLPTLYFGLKPIDAKNVKGPPVSSFVTKERGFALLRADESPAYWDSPKPAVSLQFGMYYVHYVHDCFATLQYVAHNRYIYTKMGATQGNYAGGDPWRDHVRGQAGGVIVDGLKPQPIDDGNHGTAKERIRSQFTGPFKFTSARAKGLYPDVEQEHAMVLTDDYLFDAHWLISDKPRVYDWHVLSPAVLDEHEKGWAAVDSIGGKIREQDVKKPYISDVQARDAGEKAWVVALDQSTEKQKAGVIVRMLGEKNTALVVGTPPGTDPKDTNTGFNGAGKSTRGVQLIATRTTDKTAFVSLHEPHVGESGIATFERVAQTDDAVAARVTGQGTSGAINDVLLVSAAADVEKPLTLGGNGESFTFTSQAFVRIGASKVEVFGNVGAMTLKVSGSPTLEVNGAKANATISGGAPTYKAP